MAPGTRGQIAWSRLLALWLGLANGDVQQQFLKTQTVSLTHLQDVSWPDGSDVQDSQAWTNNNQNVRTNSIVEIEFAENIQASFGYITIQPAISGIGASSASATTISVPSSDVVISGQSLLLNDASSAGGRQIVFAEETVYTLSFDAGIIQNLAMTDTNAAFSIQFTTGDFTAPTLLSMSPADESPNVPVTTTIVFTFSEDIQANPDVSGTAPTWGIQDPYQRQTPFSVAPKCSDAQISVSGASATITIDTTAFPILPCSQYQVVFAAKCFTDTSVNLNYAAALPSSSNYDWWTSCITSYSPAIGTYGVPINTDIVLTFAEQILRGTGNIVLTPLGEASQNYDVTDTSRVLIDGSQLQVTIVGDVPTDYLCLSLGADMQKCKGKPVDITIAAGVFGRVDTTAGVGSLPVNLEEAPRAGLVISLPAGSGVPSTASQAAATERLTGLLGKLQDAADVLGASKGSSCGAALALARPPRLSRPSRTRTATFL